MAVMDKLENGLNRVLVPLATRLNSQRHIVAVRDAFILAFPLTMAGSLILLLNFTVLDPNGFVAQLLQLDHIFPNLANAQQIFSPVVQGTTNIMSIFIVFMIARNMAKHYKQDDLLAGMTSVGSFFIVYTPYLNVDGANYLTTNYLGAQGLFVAMLVGLTVGELFSRLAQSKRLKIRMPEQVPSNVARSFSNLFPIIIILIVFSILNYAISLIAPNGINELIFRLIQAPLTDVGGNIWSVLLFAFLS
ncbi:PTS transporter subunit EIIC, partial [Atopococcus tabaci]|uniref:PTS transporter subunit EIIC n=1 Tax=Atopococcus tabaci TaxID=269774 RepID=UPI00240A5FA1